MFLRGYRDSLHFRYDDIIMSSWISRLLSGLMNNISELESKLMANVALRDFKNYLKVTEGFLGDVDSDYKIQVLIYDYLERNPTTLRRILEDWLDYWAVKWKQRVKLAWKDEELESGQKTFSSTENIWRKIPRRRELKELVIGSLISHKEICFTEVISESLIRGVLYKYVTSLRDSGKVLSFIEKNPVTLLNDVLTNVEKLVKTRGPLVVLKVNKKLFKLYDDWEEYYSFFNIP